MDLGKSEKEIQGEIFVLPTPNVIKARKLQARIAKTLGAPLIKFFGSQGSEGLSEEEMSKELFSGISDAIMSVDDDASFELVKDVCEMTINQTRQRPTNYLTDFDYKETKDIEVFVWVIGELFGNFLGALSQSGLGAQALQIVSPNQDTSES